MSAHPPLVVFHSADASVAFFMRALRGAARGTDVSRLDEAVTLAEGSRPAAAYVSKNRPSVAYFSVA